MTKAIHCRGMQTSYWCLIDQAVLMCIICMKAGSTAVVWILTSEGEEFVCIPCCVQRVLELYLFSERERGWMERGGIG